MILLIAFELAGFAQTVERVYGFNHLSSSEYPVSTLTQGRDGRLFSTAPGDVLDNLFGSVFVLTPTGLFKELLAFDGINGNYPQGTVTLGSDGNFYGVTVEGGSAQKGVLFKISPNGTYTILHEFTDAGDGAYPVASPIEASDGNFYGTTNGNPNSTLYRYTPSGGLVTLYQFDGSNGQSAQFPLIQATDGYLYGAAYIGGTTNCGTIFKMSTAGVMLQSYSFPCRTGGENPLGVLQAADGNFYGTTYLGGTYAKGTIFKMTPDFQVSILYSFQGCRGVIPDACNPGAGLFQATDGNLYGTTKNGGAQGVGALFQVSTSGAYRLLYSFGNPQGRTPCGSLLQHTNGLLYGTTNNGGVLGYGTVFSVDMGLGPFVTFVRASGEEGQITEVLGQGLTGTSSVTFNGVPATSFTVFSDTFLMAKVPTGAITGPVVVTTPSGTLTSNRNFQILP
jgi:uncharacterized repeat protein (TIGR03803 family)